MLLITTFGFTQNPMGIQTTAGQTGKKFLLILTLLAEISISQARSFHHKSRKQMALYRDNKSCLDWTLIQE